MIPLRTLTAALAFALCLAQGLPGAESRARFMERIPADACLAIASGDMGATCSAFQQTRIGGKLCGDAFAPLVDELTKRDLGSFLRLRPAFGFDWSELASVSDAGGLAVFPIGSDALGAAWIFTPAEPLNQTPPCLAIAADYFNRKGYRGAIAQQPGANFTLFYPPDDRDGESPRVLFVTATSYGVANSREAAEAILAVTAETSLGRQSVYTNSINGAAGDQTGGTLDDADLSFFVKPFALWQLLRAAGERQGREAKATEAARSADAIDDEPREDEMAAAERLGLTDMRAAAGVLRFDAAEPCEWTLDVNLHVERPYRGALRVLEFRPGNLPELPDWIPADVVTAGRWRWDFPLAIKGVGSMFDQALEPGPDGAGLFEDMLDGLRDDPEGVKVDLRRDLFEKLAPEMFRISMAEPPPMSDGAGSTDTTEQAVETNQPDARRWLYVANVLDSDAVMQTLAAYYRGDERVRHETFGGYDVWTVAENASLFFEGESSSLLTVRGLALGKKQLIFSTDIDMLRAALAAHTEGTALGDDPAWTRLRGWASTQRNDATAFETLLQLDRILEPSYRGAIAPPVEAAAEPSDEAEADSDPSEPVAPRFWRLLLFGSAQGSDELLYAAAPPFEQLRDALPRGSIVMSQTNDGWSIRFGVLESAAREF